MIVETPDRPERRRGAVDQPGDQARRDRARSSPASRARPASSGRSTPEPESSCGRGRRSTRTSSQQSTSRPVGRSINEASIPRSMQKPVLRLPVLLRRKEPAVGGLQSRHRNDVHADEQHLLPTCRWRSKRRGRARATRSRPGFDTSPTSIRPLQPSDASTPSRRQPARPAGRTSSERRFTALVLATAGNLLFSGDHVRRFRAFNAETGNDDMGNHSERTGQRPSDDL